MKMRTMNISSGLYCLIEYQVNCMCRSCTADGYARHYSELSQDHNHQWFWWSLWNGIQNDIPNTSSRLLNRFHHNSSNNDNHRKSNWLHCPLLNTAPNEQNLEHKFQFIFNSKQNETEEKKNIQTQKTFRSCKWKQWNFSCVFERFCISILRNL